MKLCLLIRVLCVCLQVYITDVAGGEPSVTKVWDSISQNFIIANYESSQAIDNDDGSQFYDTFSNVFSYSGGGLKSDFGGNSNWYAPCLPLLLTVLLCSFHNSVLAIFSPVRVECSPRSFCLFLWFVCARAGTTTTCMRMVRT